ncbi:ROK family protein [candidate division WOR-3 bacterium]|nr:ROK family protein [candidate division WOR-3 bacterium]
MKSDAIVGVDVGGTNIAAALVRGRRISRRIAADTFAQGGFERSLRQIKSAIAPLHRDARSIGIGVAGIIDSHRGVVRYSPNLRGWSDVPLAKILRAEFDRPVRILNDTNAICLGEWKFGVARGHDNVFLFSIGTGVGGAAICEGKLLFGANGFAGEFGHTVIDHQGPKCVCGLRGHVERYAGAKFIVARARSKMARQKSVLAEYEVLTPEIIARAARRGDRVAREVFAETGYYIGTGVSNLLALFDPEIVVIAGGIARAGSILFTPIRKAARSMVMGAEHRRFKIVPASLGDDAGILGAALFSKLAVSEPEL